MVAALRQTRAFIFIQIQICSASLPDCCTTIDNWISYFFVVAYILYFVTILGHNKTPQELRPDIFIHVKSLG